MAIKLRRGGRLVAAAAMSVGLVAGCSSTTHSASSTAAPPAASTSSAGSVGSAASTSPAGALSSAPVAVSCGANTGQPATGTPIKVGAIVGATGPADFSSSAKAAAAYFDCVNANGGIHGQPIQYLIQDDHWDPATASRAAHALVQDDGVVAMVGSTSFVECGINAAYYVQENVAVIAGVGVPRECFHSANIAPVNEGPRLSGIAAAQLAKDNGAKSIACVSNVIPNFGAWACAGMAAWGAKVGVSVKTFLGKPDASDAESTVLKALQSGSDAVVPVDAGPSQVAYLKVGQEQGSGDPKEPWFLPTSAYNLDFPKAVGPYWNNKLQIAVELAPLDDPGTDAATWRAVMDRYAKDAPRDTFSQAGFLAAKIFTDTMLATTGPITRASTTAALKAIHGYKSSLLCGPWYFGNADEHNANHAGRTVELTGTGATGFNTIGGCQEIPDPDLAPILAAEGKG
jgi:branched-chain amino acid transport system substrate-binding protein